MSTVTNRPTAAESQPSAAAGLKPSYARSVPAAPAAASAPLLVETRRSNLPGLVGLGLAIVGFVLAVFLLTAGLAWLLLIPAVALGVIGLFLRNRRKGSAVAAVVVAVMGLLLSFIGFRLPTDLASNLGALNNTGVNPASGLIGGVLAGSHGSLGAGSGTGTTGTGTGTGTGTTSGGTSTTGSSSGLALGVDSVDCHTPLATATGLNITGQVCAVKVNVTNNGTKAVDVDSSNVTATTSGGTTVAADPKLSAAAGTDSGTPLSAKIDPGQSTSGTVYVNVPQGSANLDSVSVGVDAGSQTPATVKLGQ